MQQLQTAEERTVDLPGIPAPPPVPKKTRNTVKKRAEALRDRAREIGPNALLEISPSKWVCTMLLLDVLASVGVTDCVPDTSTIKATTNDS